MSPRMNSGGEQIGFTASTRRMSEQSIGRLQGCRQGKDHRSLWHTAHAQVHHDTILAGVVSLAHVGAMADCNIVVNA